MSREVPFDKEAKCDNCGAVGAFDFMGDFFCGDCLESDPDTGELKIKSPQEPRDAGN